jgi:signal transduction histidine kinase
VKGNLAGTASSAWVSALQIIGVAAIALLIRESGRRRAAEHELGLIVDFVGVGVWRWEPKRNRLHLTPVAGKLLRGSRTRSIEKLADFLQVFRPEDRQDLERLISNAAECGAGFDIEARIQLGGNTDRWVRIGAKPAGGPLSPECVGVLTDISAQKIQEFQSQQMHDELARSIREENIGGLSGALVHELKQPLAAILTNAQAAERMLRRSPIDITELTQTVRDIIHDDSRAGDVIMHLRSLFRNDDKVWEVWNISEIVSDALKVLNRSLSQRQARIVVNIASEPLNVRGNRVQLQQVIMNLVVNAVEAMNEDGIVDPTITIETYKHGGVAVVAVKDNGAGIPEDVLSRIFDPFFTTKAQGLGLGLSICRSIVSAHRGWLEAISEKDRGATFFVNLPMAQ